MFKYDTMYTYYKRNSRTNLVVCVYLISMKGIIKSENCDNTNSGGVDANDTVVQELLKNYQSTLTPCYMSEQQYLIFNATQNPQKCTICSDKKNISSY
mgnify:CR=1 FL=1